MSQTTVAGSFITVNTIDSDHYIDGSIDLAHIGANQIDGTKLALASQAAGDIMYYNGTDWVRVGVGTDGQVLTVNNAENAPGWEAASAGATLSGSTNNTIVTVTGANAMTGEANLTFGTQVAGSNANVLKIEGDFADYANGALQIKTTHTSNTQGYPGLSFYQNDNTLLATFRPGLTSNDSGSLSIGSAGNIYFAADDADANANTFLKIMTTGHVGVTMSSTSLWAMNVTNSATTAYGRGLEIKLGTDYNASNSAFMQAVGGSTQRMLCYSNGNFINSNNSYGQISDERVKTNIEDVNSQWDDIKALRVRNFVKKDSPNHKQIGLISQEVGLISPGLIDHVPPGDFEMEYCGFGHQIEDGTDIDPDTGEETIKYKWVPNTDEDGNDVTMQTMKYSVLHMKAVKALQEAMERIEVLEVEVAALK